VREEVREKEYLDEITYLDFTKKIVEAKDIEELVQVGKQIAHFEQNNYKKLLFQFYKERKNEFVRKLVLQNNSIFSYVYQLIRKSNDYDQLRIVGKLIYALKDVIPRYQVNILFDVYERQKNKVNQSKTEEEIIRVAEEIEEGFEDLEEI
ncbi:MAG: hypothetical protein ACK4F9_07020, partial [Brevinematia bacterium]